MTAPPAERQTETDVVQDRHCRDWGLAPSLRGAGDPEDPPRLARVRNTRLIWVETPAETAQPSAGRVSSAARLEIATPRRPWRIGLRSWPLVT